MLYSSLWYSQVQQAFAVGTADSLYLRENYSWSIQSSLWFQNECIENFESNKENWSYMGTLEEFDSVAGNLNLHYWSKMLNSLINLQKMLDYYNNDLSMPQFRLLMEFFCSMAYNVKMENLQNPNHIEMIKTLREHLDMMLKKQLGSSIIKWVIFNL